MKFVISFVLVILVGLAGCAGPQALESRGKSLINADGVVTLLNLHPDMTSPPRFSAVNWIRPALLPMCTSVTILEVTKKVAKIKNNETGVVYNYFYHKAAAEPFSDHLKRYFGTECKSDRVAKLSKIDRQGIEKGKALKGMTKEGVIFALGYPARHVTPSTEADTWKYWKGRFDTMNIYFENGKVSQIVD
ncbi:MAG: hypothetical protein MI867_01085 [Pseudomonadales bacterium]|nr:hypothetical protein [Pseudomonadales bacterium]